MGNGALVLLKYLRDIQSCASQTKRLEQEQVLEEGSDPAEEVGDGNPSVQSLPMRERQPAVMSSSVRKSRLDRSDCLSSSPVSAYRVTTGISLSQPLMELRQSFGRKL